MSDMLTITEGYLERLQVLAMREQDKEISRLQAEQSFQPIISEAQTHGIAITYEKDKNDLQFCATYDNP